MIIINKSGNWSDPYDFKGWGWVLIFKKSRSEPFFFWNTPPPPHRPPPNPIHSSNRLSPRCKSQLNRSWLISTTYFMYCIRKKKKSWAWDQLKTKSLSAEDLKNAWAQWVKFEPAIRSIDADHRITCVDTSNLITTWMWNIIPKKPCTLTS